MMNLPDPICILCMDCASSHIKREGTQHPGSRRARELWGTPRTMGRLWYGDGQRRRGQEPGNQGYESAADPPKGARLGALGSGGRDGSTMSAVNGGSGLQPPPGAAKAFSRE